MAAPGSASPASSEKPNDDVKAGTIQTVKKSESLYQNRGRYRDRTKEIEVEYDADGREINPYIPRFISQAPWYADQTGGEASLRHQRAAHTREELEAQVKDQWYQRGKTAGPAATKYRKGACENCGAMTHKTRDCLERPRKIGAKWNGKNIKADDIVQNINSTWDSKRDRWNGFDPQDYDRVVQQYETIEKLRRETKPDGEETAEPTSDEEEKVHDADADASLGQGYDSSSRISTRNLRIREDVAGYLKNIHNDNVKYNPKSRTLRNLDYNELVDAEDNFVRQGGEAEEFQQLNKFSWDAAEEGTLIHPQGNPTEGVIFHKTTTAETQEQKEKARKELLDKYGGQEHLVPARPELKVNPQDRYVEYMNDGSIKNSKEETKPRSKYPEDVFPGNHTSVWGSYWKDFKWGYACCRQFMKQAYCTGEEGWKAAEAAENMLKEKLQNMDKEQQQQQPEESRDFEQEREKEPTDPEAKKRKRELAYGGVTQEEMDEYRGKRRMAEDPMAKMSNTTFV